MSVFREMANSLLKNICLWASERGCVLGEWASRVLKCFEYLVCCVSLDVSRTQIVFESHDGIVPTWEMRIAG